MQTRYRVPVPALPAALLMALVTSSAVAQSTAFTYQGELKSGGQLATGLFDLEFKLFDASSGGTQLGPTLCVDNLNVVSGRFTIEVDFGQQFTVPSTRFLEIQARADSGLDCSNLAGFVGLSPRQPITPAPDALFAVNAQVASSATTATTATTATNATQFNGQAASFYQNAANLSSGTLADARLAGSYSGQLTLGNPGNAFSGSGAGLTALNAANVSNGVLADARLSANVALKNAPNGFGSFTNTFGGSVGVNTTTPLNRLHVVSGAVGDGIRLTGGPGTDPGFQFFNGLNPGGGLGLAVSAGNWSLDAAAGDLVLRSNTGNKLVFQSGSSGSALAITSTNRVGIGTVSPAGQLDVHTANALGILGETTAATGATVGVNGSTLSTAGTGVVGFAGAASGDTIGVSGQANSATGIGIFGFTPSTSGSASGVLGKTNAPNGNGVHGVNVATTGLGNGVWGESHSGDPLSDGVYCVGNFDVTGNKSFRIDHPDDPENMYLLHYCSEGPEPLNLYQGRVITDATGYAWVGLPRYFGEINRAPEYVLTVIDSTDDFVIAKVSQEIQDNRFQIRTNKPGVSVSWEVRAVRNDRWVQRYGAPTQVPKPPSQRGTYQHPELYGQPAEKGLYYQPAPVESQR